MVAPRAQHVDQMLDGVLGGERAGHGRKYAGEHDGMRERMAADEAEEERERPVRIARELCVVGVTLGSGQMFQLSVSSVSNGWLATRPGCGDAATASDGESG
jgi:hypothetical protein